MEKATITEMLQEVRADRVALQVKFQELDILETYLKAKLGAKPASPPETNGFAWITQVQAAESVLREKGSPMSTNDIVDAMLAKGFELRSDRKTLINSVFSVMRRNTQMFRKVDKGIWGLMEWPA